MADSPFDFNNFVDTTYTTESVDFKWHNVPDGWEGLGQIVDFAGNELPSDKFNGRAVVGMKINWSLKDDNLHTTMNMDEVRCVQDIILEVVPGTSQIDWGVNKNMALKNVVKACGLDQTKKFNLGMLKNQVAWIVNKNAPDKRPGSDPEQLFSKIVRVVSVEAGRTAAAAKAT